MPNEAKECQYVVQSLVQRDNLCVLCQARCLTEATMLTLNCDNGDRYHSLSEVTRDNSDKMTRHSTFSRHWLSQSWSRHSRLERLLCPVLGPDGAGSSSGQAGLCIGNQVAVWLVAPVLPLNHTMTRVACPPGPASGHSPDICHCIRGQARSQPCSASLTWQGPSLSLSPSQGVTISLKLSVVSGSLMSTTDSSLTGGWCPLLCVLGSLPSSHGVAAVRQLEKQVVTVYSLYRVSRYEPVLCTHKIYAVQKRILYYSIF